MRKILFYFTLFILLVLRKSTVTAQLSHVTNDSIQVKYFLNPIIKTATKISGAQRDLVASISLIQDHHLRLAPTGAVLEVLQHRLPSLFVTEWGVMGFGVAGSAAGKISIRGMGGGANTHVLILRNGRPDFMGLMGCTIADEFSTDGVERIEVIRGPGSFLYGTNATGGIINIIPKTMTRDGFNTRLGGGYGAFNTKKLSLSHGGKFGQFDYFLTANQRQTNGHRQDSDYHARHYTVHMGYCPDLNTKMEWNVNLADMTIEDPGQIENPKTENWYDILRYGSDFTLANDNRLGESNIKFHANFGEHRFYDGWQSKDRILGVMIHHNIKPWEGNITTVGFDYKRYGGKAADASMDYGEIFVTEYAPYIHSQQMLWKRWIFSGGFRIENHELFSPEFTPKIGALFHATSSTTLRLSMAKGFRSPSIRELYFWMPANTDLTPDRVWNYEIGLHQNLLRKMRIELALFRSRGCNLIQLSGPPPRWTNSGKYTHIGYEVVLNWLPSAQLELVASWSDIDLSEGVFNIPEKKLTACARYSYRMITLSGSLLLIHNLIGADFPGPGPAPRLHPMNDYTVLNLSMQVQFFSFLELNLAVKNVLNTDYQTMYGYPMPGRHAMLDLYYIFYYE